MTAQETTQAAPQLFAPDQPYARQTLMARDMACIRAVRASWAMLNAVVPLDDNGAIVMGVEHEVAAMCAEMLHGALEDFRRGYGFEFDDALDAHFPIDSPAYPPLTREVFNKYRREVLGLFLPAGTNVTQFIARWEADSDTASQGIGPAPAESPKPRFSPATDEAHTLPFPITDEMMDQMTMQAQAQPDDDAYDGIDWAI